MTAQDAQPTQAQGDGGGGGSERVEASVLRQAAVLLALTTLFWGGNAVAAKFAVGHVSPFLLTAARWSIAALILWAFAWRYIARDWSIIAPRLPYFCAMGAVGFAFFNGLLYTAAATTSAINITILQAAMPLFIFLLNFAAFRTTVSGAALAGYAITLVGVILTATASAGVAGSPGATLAGLSVNWGDLLMIGAAFAYAAYSVGLRAKPEIHALSMLTLLVSVGAFAALPMALFEAASGDLLWPVTLQGWLVVAYTAIFPSILAQGFWIRGVDLIGPNRAALFLNLVPIFGALLAVLLLGERFTWQHAIALVLVIGGIYAAQRAATQR
ncbi:MAG: DMT family transporter [Pseudomonadota bacterium]